MLNQNDYVGMQQMGAQLLPDLAVIHTRSVVNDGGGGQTETFVAGITVPCRIASTGGGEKGESGSRIDDRTTHVLTIPKATVVGAKDRIVHDGVTYEVTAVRTRSWEVVRRVELMRAP
jgi:hypothetical protein